MAEQRGNLYMYDPETDLAIAGGKVIKNRDEHGDLDTSEDEDDELYDERLHIELDEPFVKNVDAFGVHTAIVIVKRNGVPFVVAGRRRVRAARRVNHARDKTGQPRMRVPATILRTNDETRLMGNMISENEGRQDDTLPAKIQKMKRYMGRGVSVEDAAIAFSIPTAMAKSWLAFEDRATPELLAAVESGRLTISQGVEISRAGEAPAQLAAFRDIEAKLASGQKTTTRDARSAAKQAKTGVAVENGLPNRREQRKLLQLVRDTSHSTKSAEKLAWFQGVEDALLAILGETDADPRIVELVKKVRAS